MSDADKEFIAKAGMGGLMEVQAGNLALQEASGEWRTWWSSERAPSRWSTAPLALPVVALSALAFAPFSVVIASAVLLVGVWVVVWVVVVRISIPR